MSGPLFRLELFKSKGYATTVDDIATADGTPEAITAWLRQAADSWPGIRPIIRVGRDAAVVEPGLTDLVERLLEEAVSDIEDGLTRAGRFEPRQRRFRGVLAMAELDLVAQNRGRAGRLRRRRLPPR
ncbi:hypothetical protein ABTY98_33540 [Streptomyces sp. NPDC096040]|uniref:hypothetical protein n=1 Tax=Streptomyces sp. NPDC096040 TaxID=3155541 RepID=UPI0033346A5F